ncbi:MAG: MurR/RpiR family transcriptional regulator [Comamonadaceae bacterium]|nr:MAG: MurR/RpiR family transcriptional regulator [Comamonadaceae bacterium]
MRDSESFVRRVRTQLDGLSSAERRLADFVLAFPGELASYAASELARLAGVSNATVTRFIQRLGYASYEDARRHARLERESGSPLFQNTTGAEKSSQLMATHLQQSQANLANTFAQISDDAARAMAKALLAAPQVLIFGSRSSHAFAVYLRWQIIQVLPRVVAVPGAGESLGEHIAGLTPKDCVVVFGVRRQTRQMRQFLEASSAAGASVIFISDRASPDFPAATWSVQCHCAGPGPLDNHVAVMALCDLLATLVIEGAGAAGRKRLSAIELSHEELDEL